MSSASSGPRAACCARRMPCPPCDARVAPAAAAATSACDQRPTRVTAYGRGPSPEHRCAARRAIPVAVVLVGQDRRSSCRVETGELRQIDRARVAQSGDDFLREIMLDLLRLELGHEAPQQLAVLVAAFAFDLDRRQHVAVALGDREVQAQVARHELLELLADGRDQRRVRAEMRLVSRTLPRVRRRRAGSARGRRRPARPDPAPTARRGVRIAIACLGGPLTLRSIHPFSVMI